MERFTNNYDKLYQIAIEEVDQFELQHGEKMIISFSQRPAIAGFPFKIALIEDSLGAIYSRFRQWDTKYDLTRWKNQIYNLDRLRIISDAISLAQEDIQNFKNIFQLIQATTIPASLNNTTALILDGTDWYLDIDYQNIKVNYHWRAATPDIRVFEDVIDFMLSYFDVNQHR